MPNFIPNAISKIPFQLSKPLDRLPELAYNLWWSWRIEAQNLFNEIDSKHWQTHRNPVKLLQQRPKALQKISQNPEFIGRLEKVLKQFDQETAISKQWFMKNNSYSARQGAVVYLSAEFGLHECLPIYCGGLGILAGDHVKTASDLGLPFVGVGLFYKNGYFTQRIDLQGRQQVVYPKLKTDELPVLPVNVPKKGRLIITVELPDRKIYLQCWRIQAGSSQLILLDSDIDKNTPKDRKITTKLYDGDRELRVLQEILLGIGGVRALKMLDVNAGVWHLNEGHVAFSCLERLRSSMQNDNLDFKQAIETVSTNTVFTTHTPVPAGNEAFSLPLMHKYFQRFCHDLKISLADLMRLGLQTDANGEKYFSMTVLALRFSKANNGVSQLHGHVSRAMWKHLWPGIPEQEVPITAITNGVHADTWIAPEMAELFTAHFGGEWRAQLDDIKFWQQVSKIPDKDLWQVHQNAKDALIGFVRERLALQYKRNGASQRKIASAERVLDPDALTIGFARRFATYKRADLIFHDLVRIEKIMRDSKRPLQLIFAGKAHPLDQFGQTVLQRVYRMAQKESMEGKVVFLENYDIDVARYMVQGVDVWLNNPRRPLEASGTSGQKVVLNGGINLSILDGWWEEGYNGKNGWKIDDETEYQNEAEQDDANAAGLYRVLEKDVLPLYYKRDRKGLPGHWIRLMKQSIASLIPHFTTPAMVKGYIEHLYLPALQRKINSGKNGVASAVDISQIKEALKNNWPLIHIMSAEVQPTAKRSQFKVNAQIYLGDLDSDWVSVEVYNVDGKTSDDEAVTTMRLSKKNQDGVCFYSHNQVHAKRGKKYLRMRLVPQHPAFSHKHELGLVHESDMKS